MTSSQFKSAAIIGLSVVAMPAFVLAAVGAYAPAGVQPQGAATNVRNLADVFHLLSSLMNMLIGLAVTAGILAFMWGMVQYLWSVGEQKEKGLQTMLWGAVAIFFMVSIWGMVNILQRTLGINEANNTAKQAPTGPGIYGGSGVIYSDPVLQGR